MNAPKSATDAPRRQTLEGLYGEHHRCGNAVIKGRNAMSPNKSTVQKYIEGFNKSDHAQILSCLTDDVEWSMPGYFRLSGRDAFDKEIENDAFTGSPIVKVTRMTEENDVVCAEGTVHVAWRAGGFLEAVFCDVFEMKNAKIRRLTTYQVNLKEQMSGASPGGLIPN
jgi:ketosteroid isomerase-like protein